jgi:hypothetical protein
MKILIFYADRLLHLGSLSLLTCIIQPVFGIRIDQVLVEPDSDPPNSSLPYLEHVGVPLSGVVAQGPYLVHSKPHSAQD